jgi:type II secretory pathway pseudopilin PulG
MRKTRCQFKNTGFSLVEVVLAIAIVATSLLLFIGVFLTMFRASEKGVDLTAATVVAESQLNKFLYWKQEQEGGLDGLGLVGDAVEPGGSGKVKHNTIEYTYEIKSRIADPAMPNLRKVDVTVYWWGDDANPTVQTKTGYGNLHVTLSKLIYTKNTIALNPEE